MKSNKIKKIAMVVLLAVAGYIWWGNLSLFRSTNGPHYAVSHAVPDSPPVDLKNPNQIEYVEPKINPFKKDIKKKESQPSRPNEASSQRSRSQASSPKPSSRWILRGLIGEKESAQAIIVTDDGNSAVVSVKDSVDSWVLTQIHKDFVVFRRDKGNDTLWLYGIKP